MILGSKFKIFDFTVGVTLVIAFFAFKPASARAASLSGVTVSPAYQQVSIPQGVASQPIKFTVTNHESQAQTIALSTQDFNTLGETGGLVFVGSTPTQLEKEYGLAKWISLPKKQLILQPSQTATINADILNLPSLAPGGHYGALMLSLNSSPSNVGGVNLHPIASSLLFVTKIGGDTHKLALTYVQAKHSFFSLPSKVTLQFHNVGNTHVVPRGVVTIIDGSGRLVSRGVINEDSDIVLPSAFRLLDVPMQRVDNSHTIGKYKLVVDFRFDGINAYRRYQTGLWILPPFALSILASIAIVLAIALTTTRKIHTHKHRTNN